MRGVDGPRLALLVGAPRSGTTWLQTILGSHPDVATPQETDLFSRYVAPLEAAWAWQMRGGPDDWVARRLKGLPGVLTRSQLLEVERALVREVLEATVAMKPGATVVVEKSPSHSLCVDVIRAVRPDAPFVHVVRDGRDVAASLVRAAQGWGAAWAPATLAAAAAMWVEHVLGARDARSAAAGYCEVRYEVLRAGGAPAIVDVFAAIGVTVDEAEAQALLDAERLDDARTRSTRAHAIVAGGEFAACGPAPEPEGFFGSGGGDWQHWSARERADFVAVAGPLLVELGYAPDDAWAGAVPGDRTRRLRRATARVIRGTAARAARAIEP